MPYLKSEKGIGKLDLLFDSLLRNPNPGIGHSKIGSQISANYYYP